MSQNGGDGQDGGRNNRRAGKRAGAAEISGIWHTGLASTTPVETVAWFIFF